MFKDCQAMIQLFKLGKETRHLGVIIDILAWLKITITQIKKQYY